MEASGLLFKGRGRGKEKGGRERALSPHP